MIYKQAASKSLLPTLVMALLVFLAALPAFGAGERLTFSNTNPQVLAALSAEGLSGGLQVDGNGRSLGQLELDGALGAFYAFDDKLLQANLLLDGGKDAYRFVGLAECAGLVEVSFGSPASETQIRANVLEGRRQWVTQAVATSGAPTSREILAVRGGVQHKIDVSWTGGIDAGGEAATFTRSFDVAVGCDQVVALQVGGRIGREEAASLDAGDLLDGSPLQLPRREPGAALLGQPSELAPQALAIQPSQTCESDDFADGNLDGWTFSFIGDADQGGAVATGGTVKLTADGTTYYHAPDNGGFLHRPVTGDFRAQVKLLGFPSNTGGGFKKTSLTVRSGLGADDPRVTVQFIPNHPTYNTTAIQFDYRDAAGVEHELASTPLGVAIPAYLMIERRGSVFSAYYSNDGSSWIRQLGGSGNAASIPMPGTVQIGMMNASYSATITLTAEFDDFKVCSPNVINLPPIPPHGLCMPGTPIDILYLLDSTGSMTFPFSAGGVSKLDAARSAIKDMNDLIEANLPGSRAALVTFQGGFTPAYNLNSAVRTLSHLTTDFDAVDAAAASIDVSAINPDATTPIAIALDRTYTIFQNEADPTHVPVVIFIGDGWPNIDMGGNGPGYYRFEEMQAISIGAYLPPGQVAWLGNFNGPLNSYDGQVLADAMNQTLRLKEDIPNFMMFTLGVHSNATFRPDLLGFMALYTGADFYDVTSAQDLVNVLVGVYNGLDCGAQIGDRVWDDANGDGIQDPGEAGLEGVTVELVDGDGDVVDTQVTDADGNYLFDHVYPATYTVRVVPATLPAGWGVQTYDYDGLGTADAASVTVADDQIFLDADFGYRRYDGGIGDRVWNDANGDGIQDPGEAGIAGVTVELRDASNVVIGTQVTDANGIYNFTDLAAGTYTVTVVPAGLGAGNIPTFDRDGIATPHTATVVLAANQTISDADFGYRACAGSISDRIWLDQNGNGGQDPGEPGIGGVTLELLDGSSAVIASTVSAADGTYSFGSLPAGTYTVRIVTSTLPAGSTPSYDPDGVATPNQATLDLGCDQTQGGIDFGYDYEGSIGDRVWNDENGDGVQDGGEAGLAGVTVELRDSSNALVATQVTDAAGNYSFTGLAPDTYTVTVVPAGLGSTNIPTFDRDGIGTPNAATVVLAASQNVTDADFGYRGCDGSIGDRVWLDANNDGVQDPGETGIGGLTVELLDGSSAVIATTVTDAAGAYSFGDLAAGAYTVRVVAAGLPAGATPSYDLDSVATAHRATVKLGCDQDRDDVDFGYASSGSIGDRVWNDTDGDGVQDAGEVGLTGVTVELRDASNVVIATTVTGANGIYGFPNLAPGTYTVTVVPAGLGSTNIPTFDRDGIATANAATVVLAAGQNVTDADFGYRGCDGSIGDRVWLDADADGIQDRGETGIGGLTVELLDASNTVVATTVTDGSGAYSFGGLAAGAYTVRIVTAGLPAGATPSYDLDSVATAHQATVKLGCDQDRDDLDFGYTSPGSIGDRVWKDTDGDGVQDAGEVGLTGVTVELRNASNVLIATTVTGANGIYGFPNLAPGTYRVVVLTGGLAGNTTPTFDRDGIATPNVATIVLASGQNVTDADFGYRACAGSIGDKVWDDKNGNGVKDSGENGLNNVTLQLVDASNAVIATTTTNSSGTYTFSNVAPGTYTVRVVSSTLPVGATPTFDLDGIVSPHQATVTLSCGQVKTDVDFGYKTCLGSIGDKVWDDKNGNGTQNSGEGGIAGVTLQLLDASSNVVATTTTNSSGAYTFTGLVAGTYTVRIVTATLPAGFIQTYDRDGLATPHAATVTLTCNQNKTDIDFGYKPCLGTIGDRVWDDKDGDGVQDGGETGIGGVSLQLLDSSNAVVATATTNSSGNYSFTGVAAGTYTVRVVAASLPAGTSPSFDLDGIATAHQATVTLSCNQTKSDVDFGYKTCLGSIGDKVWDDKNGNGSQGSGEPGLAGVTVQLLNASNVVIATTTTNSSGVYNFGGLDAGTYTVRIVASSLPAGYSATYDKDGVATLHTATVTLSCNQNRTDVDFGYKGCQGSIGDLVWDDKDGDGVKDGGEGGIGGVTVKLYNSSNALVATATTNSQGKYSFTGINSGTYTVKVDIGTVGTGAVPTFDLDGTGSANQATVVLSCNQARTDVDFGYKFCDGWIGDRVWDDKDGDGVQDGGETGLDGVHVQLVNSSNVVVATYITKDGGWYQFSNVAPGTWIVRIVTSTLPDGYDTATHDFDGLGSLHQATFVLNCAGKNEHVDFGYRDPSTGGGWCPRTIGYWKTHTSEWPVRNLKLGVVTYNQTQLLAILNSTSSDATYLLAKQLVATKLNLRMGSASWIQSIVDEADKFLEDYPLGSNPQGGKRDWALKLKDDLDKYNNDPNCH